MHYGAGIVLGLAAWTMGAECASAPTHVVTYEVAAKGLVVSDLDSFRSHVRRTLRHPQGWSQRGDVLFLEVAREGDFVLWLAEDVELPGYSSVCTADWSCRVGRNVVINETRWMNGAPGWKGDLESYRHYVVNHEVGHWLGLGHRGCERPGDPAPVMMQQSKSADPCRNRTWPSAEELSDAMRAFESG